ncbi:MAG TPA: hypothetical protein ENK76_04110 [Campylobacterales bacterium]|nr:hypothetical protein [Nitratifractor sp.]HHH51535.1 hypothetical protein [Campylobacterales bacterium]
MVKNIFMMIVLSSFIYANESCVECHRSKNISLRKTFMKALLVYGGEKNFKTALFYYCKNPSQTSSVMDEEFLEKYIPLKPIGIDDEILKKLIDKFWHDYKIKGNLK